MARNLLNALFLALVLAIPRPGWGDALSDNFSSEINIKGAKALDALSKDLGAVIGAGTFHQGKVLGWFPVGFDVGVHAPIVDIKSTNGILTDNDSTMSPLWGQIELGLPQNFNVIGRYGELYDARLQGIGLRYGILNPPLPYAPGISVTGIYNKFDHDFFDQDTWTVNFALSFDVAFIDPYIGGGYDKSTLEPTSRAFNGVSNAIPRNIEGEAEGYRAEAGINISPLPFTYITLGIGLANGEEMLHMGAGAQF